MNRRTRNGVRTATPLDMLLPPDCRKKRNGRDPVYMFQLGYEVGRVEGDQRYDKLRGQLQDLVDVLDNPAALADGVWATRVVVDGEWVGLEAEDWLREQDNEKGQP